MSSMLKIKHTEESPQTVPVERPAETASPAEPAHVERVTKKNAKDQKKVVAGRAGAAARQKRLLQQLQAAKESLRPPVSAADNIARLLLQRKRSHRNAQMNGQNITITGSHASLWLVLRGGGGSLAYVYAGENMCLHASPASVATGPAPKVQDKPPPLKACPDPNDME